MSICSRECVPSYDMVKNYVWRHTETFGWHQSRAMHNMNHLCETMFGSRHVLKERRLQCGSMQLFGIGWRVVSGWTWAASAWALCTCSTDAAVFLVAAAVAVALAFMWSMASSYVKCFCEAIWHHPHPTCGLKSVCTRCLNF